MKNNGTRKINILIGAGAIGSAIAEKLSHSAPWLIADHSKGNAENAAQKLRDKGVEVQTATADVTSRQSVHKLIEKALSYGEINGLIYAAGLAPSQSTPETILKVDLFGTALVLEEFGRVVSKNSVGLVVSSQAGHQIHLSQDDQKALGTTPVDNLLDLPFLRKKEIQDSYHAYKLAKAGCSVRVSVESLQWGKRGARLNAISPGVTNMTSMADTELQGPRAAEYQSIIRNSPLGRDGSLEEIASLGAHLMGAEGAFITGSDYLIDGGMTAAHWWQD